MPKSKRQKVVPLTKTGKKGVKLKENLVEELHRCCDVYPCLFVIRVENMRNVRLKELRSAWGSSRFFFGKNKVMVKALGTSPADEYKDDLHKVSQCISGNCGLLFTDKSKDDVVKFFASFSEPNYARSGCVATEDVNLQKGPMTQPGSMEVLLRKLGLKTLLKGGVIQLLADTQICKKGDVLTPEQCHLLELLDVKMADFRITVDCAWSNGEFERLAEEAEDGDEGDDAELEPDDADGETEMKE
jgi:mRNA turnover protein 4